MCNKPEQWTPHRDLPCHSLHICQELLDTAASRLVGTRILPHVMDDQAVVLRVNNFWLSRPKGNFLFAFRARNLLTDVETARHLLHFLSHLSLVAFGVMDTKWGLSPTVLDQVSIVLGMGGRPFRFRVEVEAISTEHRVRDFGAKLAELQQFMHIHKLCCHLFGERSEERDRQVLDIAAGRGPSRRGEVRHLQITLGREHDSGFVDSLVEVCMQY
jgi:hypothetical protein